VGVHEGRRDTENAIAGALQLRIPARIEVCAALMIAAIHLDDEPHTRRTEISDVATHDELTPKCDAEATSPQLIPQASFRRREMLPHALRAQGKLLLTLRDLATLIR